MQRFHQTLFIVSLLALSWLLMMTVHELGHVIGAIVTGGEIQRVVLHPLAISRTDVSPNPHPSTVVWLGPILGSVLPSLAMFLCPRRLTMTCGVATFFAGFCLIANGAYIGIGAIDHVGDCREMIRTGSPMWLLMTFGALSIGCGGWCWHRLGSLNTFLANPAIVSRKWAYAIFASLVSVIVLEVLAA